MGKPKELGYFNQYELEGIRIYVHKSLSFSKALVDQAIKEILGE